MRIVVVGAGIIGLACGYELARDGHDVTVIDAGQPGHGASMGSAAKIALAETAPVPAPGMVLQGLKWMLNPDSPLYIQPSLKPDFVRFMVSMARHCNIAGFRHALQAHLTHAAPCLELLDRWKDEGITFEEHSKGVRLVYEHRQSLENHLQNADLFAEHGYVAEALDSAALHNREPCLADHIRYGLHYPQDRQVEPESLTDSLAQKLIQKGHRIIAGQRVVDFGTSTDRMTEVRTESDTFPCDAAILAAGAQCGPLTRQLGSPLPIRPGKGYSVDYADPPTKLSTPLTFEDAHVAVTPLDRGIRIAGTMEFSGFTTSVRHRRVVAMTRAAAAGFADWQPPPHTDPWGGLRPMTPDGMPIVGRLPRYDNVFIASGHGMLGLTMAPSTADSIAGLVRGNRPPSSLQAFSPSRFRR